MRKACPSIFKYFLDIKQYFFFASVIVAGAIFISVTLPSYAQLPPTNMGQFVHQPGDNQYTNQTQAERHAPVMQAIPVSPSIPAPTANNTNTSNASSTYTITPATPKPDISLMPIVADEPIKPAGFPPLPDRLDLPAAAAGVWTSNNGPGGSGTTSGGGAVLYGDGISREPQGVHQHYVHYQAGAFMPNQAIPQNTYRPSSSDYYNINPNARAGMSNAAVTAAPPADTPSMQALKTMGPEPQLAADRVTKPEAPTAVTVNQSVSQDLSLPEDDFNKHYPTNIGNSKTSRVSNGMGRMLVYPLRSLGYTAAGMAAGAASYGTMYAIRR